MDTAQLDVWEFVQALNRAWTQGNPATLADFFHADMVAITPVDRERRVGRTACVAGWAGFAQQAVIHSWREIDPLVRLYGDTAVVTYYYEMECTMDGRELTLTGRDMFTVARIDGRWWAVANQFSNYP